MAPGLLQRKHPGGLQLPLLGPGPYYSLSPGDSPGLLVWRGKFPSTVIHTRVLDSASVRAPEGIGLVTKHRQGRQCEAPGLH